MSKTYSLWYLASVGKQPSIQYMDKRTLDKIRENRPLFRNGIQSFSLTKAEIDRILCFAPNESWFLNPSISKSIHGISHMLRVTILVYILCSSKAFDQDSLDALLLAASVHDTQRYDDKADEGHEDRASSFLTTNNFSSLSSAIRTEAADILKQKSELTEILRAADALDRYRLPKIKWWINDKYLLNPLSDDIKSFAFDFMVKSENEILNGKSHQQAVINYFL